MEIEEDVPCDLCDQMLITEREVQNRVCLSCMAFEEQALVVSLFDDLIHVCLGIMSMRAVIACDLRCDHQGRWDNITSQLQAVLRRAHRL